MSISFIYPTALWLLLLLPLTAGLALLSKRRTTRARSWGGLVLRLVLLALIVLALAGMQLRRQADMLTAVFVLDASDSVSAEEQARGEAFIRRAIQSMPAGDQAAVVVFGRDALVERLASPEQRLADLTSVPVTQRTDIAAALQLGLALFPDEGAKRLVLLSDGRENLGHALAQAELAAAHDVGLSFVPLGQPAGGDEVEVRLESLDAPADVRQGQGFDLIVQADSTAQVDASLRVFGDGQLIHSQDVRLQPGTNRFMIPVQGDRTGFRRFRAQIVPDADTRLQNNQASAFTVVYGPPRVLMVEGQPGEGDNLAQALRSAQMEVTAAPPDKLPTSLAELAAYDAVVLANVPVTELPSGVMETLQVYVRDLGKGLLMTGGENSFGAGGYLRTPLEETLPVDMDVRTREQSPNLALVLAVDKSGSMGRCHCDNPDLDQTYVRREVGQPKVDIAKEAIMRAAGALGGQDYLGVVAFDESARWAVDLQQLGDLVSLEQSIGGIQAQGQTNLRSGVEAAFAALQGTNARRKHLILLTDGWVHEGELSDLARTMQEQGITLSVVAAGGGAAEYLADLARAGGGRYYPAVDILRVPDFFLKETVKAVGQYIVEEPFYPLPTQPGSVLRGLDPAALPPLLGYNGTTPKSTAFMALATPRGDPLLATWQYGLGRAAAWTSDLKGQWAVEWVTWEGFPRFAAQLVGWTLPPPQIEGLHAQAELEGDYAMIQVEAAEPTSLSPENTDQGGRPRNFLDVTASLIDPDLEVSQAQLAQTGTGRYQAQVEVAKPGTYLVRLAVSEAGRALGQQTLGLVVPYSPEYRASGTDLVLLRHLAGQTGQEELAEPRSAFLHNLPLAARAREIWRSLLLIAALLFPLDVALRRVMLGPRDFRRAMTWLRQRLPARRPRLASQERVLGHLFQARDRVRQRRPESKPLPHAGRETPAEPAQPPGEVSPGAASSEDPLARLRQAKRRARKDR
jgi:Mg-chelatase subunit ChlD